MILIVELSHDNSLQIKQPYSSNHTPCKYARTLKIDFVVIVPGYHMKYLKFASPNIRIPNRNAKTISRLISLPTNSTIDNLPPSIRPTTTALRPSKLFP